METEKRRKIKSERGSVTVYVLTIMLLFVIILALIYMAQMSKISNQEKQILKIQENYNVEKELDKVYYELESKMHLNI